MSNKRIWQDILESSPGIAEKMALVAFDVDSFKDPEDALSQRAAAAKTRRQRKMYADLLEDWEGRNFESLVQELAKNTGADPAQIGDKNTRTPEQQQALMAMGKAAQGLNQQPVEGSILSQIADGSREAVDGSNLNAEI